MEDGKWKLRDGRWRVEYKEYGGMEEEVQRGGGSSMERGGWREYAGYCIEIGKRIQTHIQIILEHNSIK